MLSATKNSLLTITIVVLLLLSLNPMSAWSQKKLTWKSTSSTAWETAANWYDEHLGGASTTAPTSADTVVVNNSRGATVNLSITTATQGCKILTVGSGFVLTISGSTDSLTVGDGVAGNNDITIQSGGEIDNLSTLASGNSFRLLSSSNDRFRVDNGGKYLHNTSASFSTPFPASQCSFDSTSTVEFGQSSSTTVPFSGMTYGNLILSATSAKSYTASGASNTFVNGTLTLGSSNVSFSPNMTNTTRVNNLTITGGTFSPTATSAWTLQFTGNITNNGTITLPSSNLSIVFDGNSMLSGSAVVTFNNGFSVNGSKILANSILGNILGSGKTATINGTFQINQGSWTGSNGTFTYDQTNGTLIFNNTSGSYGAIDSSHRYWPAVNGPVNVYVQGAGGITMGVARTVKTSFQTSAGVLTANDLTLNGTVTLNGGGYFTASPSYGSSSTLIYNSGGPYGVGNEWTSGTSAGSGVPKNITLAGGTTVNMPTTARTCPGNLTIANGTLNLSSTSGGDLNVGGNWTFTSGAFNANSRAVSFNGSALQTINGWNTFAYLFIADSVSMNSNVTIANNLTINSGKTLLCNSDSVYFSSGSGMTNNGTFNAGTGDALFEGSGSVTGTTSFNNVTLTGSGGVSLTSSSTVNGTLEIQGNNINTGQAPNYGSSSILKYSKNGNYSAFEEWYTNTPSGSGVPQNVFIAAGTSLDFGTSAFPHWMKGDLTLNGTFILSTAAGGDLKIAGNWTRNSGGILTPNTRSVEFNGSTSQTLTGQTTFDYLNVTNANGLTLNSNLIIDLSLTLGANKVITGSNKVSFATGSSVSRTTGYIYGNVEKNYSATETSHVFQIGDATNYTPVSLQFHTVTGSGTVLASTTPGDHPNIAASGVDPSKSVNRYWSLAKNGFTFDVDTLTLNWVAGDLDGSADTSKFIARNYNGGSWLVPVGVSNRTGTSIQILGDTSLGDFVTGNINCLAISIHPTTLPNGLISAPYNQSVTASGGTTSLYTYSLLSGTLPPGISLSNAGVISGTPTALGTSYFTVQATDTNGCTGSQPDTLTITCPTITITPKSLAKGTIDSAYNQTLSASGGKTPYSFAVTNGSLPSGLSLSSSGALTGTPSATGTSIFTVSVTDSDNCTGSLIDTLTINCSAISISPSKLPNCSVDSSYNQLLTASGGKSPYTFSVSNGALPAGFHLSSSGMLTGTPAATGTSIFTVTVTDSNGCTGSQTDTISIYCSTITISPSSLPNGAVDSSYSQQLTGSGGKNPYTFAVANGALPAGLNLSTSGLINGSPTANNASNFTVTATDSFGCTGTQSYTILTGLVIDTITASSDTNGTINPSGKVLVTYGTNQSFSISPKTGYHIANVLVDGHSVGAETSYTFDTVKTNHTISASFAVNTFHITASSGANGSISPSGIITVNYGSDTSFTFNPSGGYQVDSVIVDSVLIISSPGHTFTNVQRDHTIRVTFSPVTYVITASAGPHGSVTPAGSISVKYNADTTFTFTPLQNYKVDSIIVDGNYVGNGNTYKFTAVSAPHTLRVTFVLYIFSIQYPYSKGWNMVSVPLTVSDYAKTTIFPSSVSSAFAYNNGYVPQTTLANGVAYWLKFNVAVSVTMTGRLRPSDSISVNSGWNMIGSISSPVYVHSITSVPGGIVTSDFFGYSGGYTIADSIIPGKGYWVKTSQAGKLIFSSGSGSVSSLNKIRILPNSELPPSPPEPDDAYPVVHIPDQFALHQNYPNPFNPSTVISYELPSVSHVSLKIYNAVGEEVATLIDGVQDAGYKMQEWNASEMPSGVYICRIQAVSTTDPSRTFTDVKKLMLIK